MRDALARAAVSTAMSRGVRSGRIEVVEGGRRRAFGPADADLRATVTVNDPAAWRGPLRGSVGLGEGYVDGLWETDDLVALIRIAARELRDLDGLRGAVARSRGALHRLRRLVPENTRAGSRRNISAHYDLGNDLFATFLDERMMYSCAYFPRPGASLEEAQVAKLDRICDRLRLRRDSHLLEIGTGWGGLAVHAAREHGCRVTTTTISREQHELASRRVREAGLADRVTVLLEDYRDLRGRYDRLVSVEMIEAVGWQYFDDFFRRCDRLLAPDGADAAAGDHDRRLDLRGRERRPQLRQHPRLPRRLPALAGGDRRLRRPRHQHARGLARGHHRPLPADPGAPGASASSAPGSGCARAATTSASAASGTSTSPPRRRASASAGSATCRRCSPSRAGRERGGRGAPVGTGEPLLLIHGLGASGGGLGPGAGRCWRASARCWCWTCPASARRRRCPPGSSRRAANLAAALRAELRGARGRAAARRRQLARRLGRAGDGARRLGRLGDRDLPRRPLAGAAGPAQGRHPRPGPPPAPAGRSPACGSRPCARRALATFAAHPERIPAGAGRELVLGWIDSNGYDGANRAMRTHLFDPDGYPEDVPVTIAWGEHDRLVGPPKPHRRPAGARFLALPGVGHTPTWDDPELVARTLLEGSRARAHPQTSVIVERTENPQWLSNAYLVADPEAGTGVLIDGNDRARPAAGARRARRDRDHPHPRHPPPRRPRRRPRRGARAARQPAPGRPRRRPPPSSTRRSRCPRRRRQAAGAGASRSRRSTPPATPPATSPTSSTAPTSSPPTSSSRARSAARWRRARAASTTSGPR